MGDQERGDHSSCFSPCGDGGPYTAWREMEKASTNCPVKKEDGARAVWGDISRPQVPHERLISCYTAPLLHFCAAACEEKNNLPPPSPNFSEEKIQLLQCRGAAIKSRHCTC